jgi:hypothetical protein
MADDREVAFDADLQPGELRALEEVQIWAGTYWNLFISTSKVLQQTRRYFSGPERSLPPYLNDPEIALMEKELGILRSRYEWWEGRRTAPRDRLKWPHANPSEVV